MKHNAYFRLLQSLIIFLLCQCCFASIASNSITANKTDYYKERPNLGGQAAILNMQTSYSEQESETYFKINVPAEGDYYLHFWAIIPKTKSGVYTKYKVQINGVLINETINATSNEWHYAPLSGSGKAHLKQGINSIKVIGTPTNFPNVELVYVSKIGAIPKVNGYNKLKTAISMQNPLTPYPGNAQISTPEKSTTNEPALNEYEYFNGTGIYTFTTQVYIQKGQTISVKSKSLGEKPHVLEVFGRNYKDYSWAVKSNGSEQLTFNQIAPRSGVVRIRVRTLNQGDLSFGKLTINDSIMFEKVPMSNSSVICSALVDKECLTFTTKSSGDPILYFEETSNNPGKIIAHCDDYAQTTGNTFNWKTESRIESKPTSKAKTIHISSAFSHDPYTTYELYVGCTNYALSNRYHNMGPHDGIQSSGMSKMYNCIAWTAGITSHEEWPLAKASPYRAESDLESFDNFYNSMGYTREGATVENSMIDLYVGRNNNKEYFTHASIKNGTDQNPHGYDWESKLGSWERIFHPRYGLTGGPYLGIDSLGYGQVKYHYIRKSDSPMKSLAEKMADGSAYIEYPEFTTEEESFIQDKLNTINSDVLQKFDELYDEWSRIYSSSYHSNPDIIADCDCYHRLLGLTYNYPELKYALFNRLNRNDWACIKPFEDIVVPHHKNLLFEIKSAYNKRKEASSVELYRTTLSNVIDLAKALLALETGEIGKEVLANKTTDIKYSNFQDFEINNDNPTGFAVHFYLEEDADILIQVKDLAGNSLYASVKSIYPKGEHTEFIPIYSKGTILVNLIVNGKVNIKKYIL